MRRRADATQRLRAVQASHAPEGLIAALDDPSPEVARAAIDRLVELEGQGAAAPLRARLFDVDLSLVADVANALRRTGDSVVVEVAIAALGDHGYSRRLTAVRALGALADARAADSLRMMLKDDVAGVRSAALDALAKLGAGAGEDADADYAPLLSDPVPHVRIAAVRAVARLVTHPGAMLAPAADDDDRLVRREVAQHVARLPDGSARALLGDPDLRVREAAARTAGKREVGVLAVLLIDDPSRDVRRAAAHTLGAMQDERVADLLLPSLEDSDALVRAAVLHALQHLLSTEGLVRRLCDELAGQRAERRRASLYALARLDAGEAVPDVSRVVDDPDPEVRLALVHTAETLFDQPEPVISYLSTDPDQAVRDAAEMWLLRTTRAES